MYAVVAMNRPWFSWQARFCEEQNHLRILRWEQGLLVSFILLELYRETEALAHQLGLPSSSPSPGRQGRGNLHLLGLTPLPPPPVRALGWGVVNDSNQVVYWPFSWGGGGNLSYGPPWSLGAASLCRLCPTLRGSPCRTGFPSSLPLFIPLPPTCSLKLACGTQGQTDYSFPAWMCLLIRDLERNSAEPTHTPSRPLWCLKLPLPSQVFSRCLLL